MNARIFLFGLAVFSLSACSSLKSLLTFEDKPSAPAVAAASEPPPPQAAASNEWCQRVAASERQRAQQAGFDAATLDRMAVQGYQQCVAMGAR